MTTPGGDKASVAAVPKEVDQHSEHQKSEASSSDSSSKSCFEETELFDEDVDDDSSSLPPFLP